MISVNDVAALVVVANRGTNFNHKLPLRHIDIKWVLDVDNDGSSPARFRGCTSPKREFAAQHGAHKSILDVDWTLSEEAVDAETVLLTSPRSALVVLKKGFGVADLLATPQQRLHNQGLLDGSDAEAMRMRVAADRARRDLRREVVMADYSLLCEAAEREQVVEAMREAHFAAHRQDRMNVEAAASSKPLVPGGKLDLTLLDEDCLRATVEEQDRAARDMRRLLEQRERQRDASLNKERSIKQQHKQLAGNAERSNVHRDRLILEKSAAAAQRRKVVHDRVSEMKKSAVAAQEQKLVSIVDTREADDRRAQEQRKMTRIATVALFQSRDQRHGIVRERAREMMDDRRDAVEAGLVEKHVFHDRQMKQQVHDHRVKRTASERRLVERKDKVDTMRKDEADARAAKLSGLVEAAEVRAKEFATTRLARQQDRSQRCEDRRARGRASRAVAASRRQQRMEELDTDFVESSAKFRETQARNAHASMVKGVEVRIARTDHLEEQRRSASVNEFSNVGYIGGNSSKTAWISREAEKRRTLAAHIKAEREAISRARDDVLTTMNSDEVKQRRHLELAFR
jgi:hypothetical protein